MNIAIVVVILLIVAFAIYNIIMGNKPKKQQEAQKKGEDSVYLTRLQLS